MHAAHTVPEVVVTLSKQAFIFVFVLTKTKKMVYRLCEVCFLHRKKGLVDLSSAVMFVNLSLAFSLFLWRELVNETHTEMVLLGVFLI